MNLEGGAGVGGSEGVVEKGSAIEKKKMEGKVFTLLKKIQIIRQTNTKTMVNGGSNGNSNKSDGGSRVRFA